MSGELKKCLVKIFSLSDDRHASYHTEECFLKTWIYENFTEKNLPSKKLKIIHRRTLFLLSSGNWIVVLLYFFYTYMKNKQKKNTKVVHTNFKIKDGEIHSKIKYSFFYDKCGLHGLFHLYVKFPWFFFVCHYFALGLVQFSLFLYNLLLLMIYC